MTVRDVLARVFGEAGSAPVETELRPAEVVERARRGRRVALAWRGLAGAGATAVVVIAAVIAPGLVQRSDQGPIPADPGGPRIAGTSETAPRSTHPQPDSNEPSRAETGLPGETGRAVPPPTERGRSSAAPPAEETPARPSWDTSVESGGGSATAREPAQLIEMRTGSHPPYDRVVYEFASEALPEYEVRYLPEGERLRSPGSGRPVEIAGEHTLEVTFRQTRNAGLDETTQAPGHPVVREVKYLGGFEQVHSAGIGVSGDGAGERLGFRVDTLDDPARIVIDVAKPAPAQVSEGARQR